jgi:hypothetical protein
MTKKGKRKKFCAHQDYRNGVTFLNLNITHPKLDIAPMSVSCNSWRYTAGVRKPKHCTIGYFWGLSEGDALSWFDSYRVADKSLARPGRKQATATEDFDVHISYL